MPRLHDRATGPTEITCCQWPKGGGLVILNQHLIVHGLRHRKIVQLTVQKLLMYGDREETHSDSCHRKMAFFLAGVSQKVGIAQILEMGFQLTVDRFHGNGCWFP